MQTRSLIALCIAILAAAFIIIAGKSCTEDIAKQNKKHPHLITDPTTPFNTANLTPPNYTPTSTTEDSEDESETKETTDFFSEIVTDEFGIIIETTAPNDNGQMYMIVTDANGEISQMIPVTKPDENDTPTTLDFLDQYHAEQASKEAAEKERHEADTTEFDPNRKLEIPFIDY
ncbi:MAG: hypothetical protein J5723_00625 [Ruminococcus sp.]|nr:hypothetical protein [Ruminococcus sp.]